MIRALIPILLVLAHSGFAQDAGMYYVVFLRPDPGRAAIAKAESDRIQSAHMANIQKMAAGGVLAAAGPLGDEAHTISGVFVMKAASLDEAKRIAASDPTVVEHRNTVDVHAWRGPAGIGEEYFKIHREHPETPEGMGVHPLAILSRGPAWKRDAEQRATDELVARLRREGKLAAAGRVEGEDAMTALVIFKRIPLEEAQRLLQQDPAVAAGIFRAEFHTWWSADHVLPW